MKEGNRCLRRRISRATCRPRFGVALLIMPVLQLGDFNAKGSWFGATRAQWKVSNPAMKRSFDAAKAANSIALESVSVASPCHADWDAMRGDERARFCPSCAKNVYNLSAMTTVEAQSLIAEKEGKLCIRFFQREDGTMLTADCPLGAAAWKQKSPAFALWASVMSLVVLLVAATSPALLPSASAQPETKSEMAPTSTATPQQTATPTPSTTAIPVSTVETTPAMMGGLALAPPPTPTPTAAPHLLRNKGHYMKMGKIAVRPAATPTPTPRPPMVMGRVSIFKPPVQPTKPKPKRGSSGAQS